MLLNKRIHLNTSDAMGAKKSTFENHANSEFDLSKGRCICDANLDLKLGLVKSMIPPDLSIMGTSETHPVFEIILGQAVSPPFTTGRFYFYFTDTKYEFPYGVGNPDSVYIPMSHIDSVETFIGIVNQVIDVATGGSPTTLLAIDNIDNTLTTSSSVNTIYIPMSLYNPKVAPLTPLDAYRPQNETIMRMLGINIDIQSPDTSTHLGFTIINRDIKYPVGLYKPPILVKTNLSLNSVSSNPKLSGKILASINCDIALASESYNFIFTPQTPAVFTAPPATYTLTLDNHPYTPALNGDYISVGGLYRDNSPPRYFKESPDHHLFRMDTATNTYLLFSYGIHQTATWYIGIYPLLSLNVDYLNENHTTLGQISQHSIGTGWNAFTGGGIGHYPSAAYTPSHTLVGVYA